MRLDLSIFFWSTEPLPTLPPAEESELVQHRLEHIRREIASESICGECHRRR